MIRKYAATAVVAFLAGIIACGRERSPELSALQSQEDAFLLVTNDHWLDVDVFALRSGTRHRLGTVRGNQVDTIPLRLTIVAGGGPVRLVAEPIGSTQRHLSEPIQVGPAEWVEFRIRDPLNLSSITVWRPDE